MTTRTTLAFAALLFLRIGAISPAANAQISSCPFAIFGAGNYTVTANLTATTGDCITVAASNVTIDLQGHTITGPGSAMYNGITDTGGPLQSIIIANGTIKGFNEGIFLGNTSYVTISNINAMQNTSYGIQSIQPYNMVTDSQANKNGSGIGFGGDYDTVTNSRANNNVDFGMTSDGNYTTVTDSLANNNGEAGFDLRNHHNIVTHSEANGNGSEGIFSSGESTVIHSRANGNGTAGIGAGMFFRDGQDAITDSTANGNQGDGIDVTVISGGSQSLLNGNTASGNSGVGMSVEGSPCNLFGNTALGSSLPACTLLDNNF